MSVLDINSSPQEVQDPDRRSNPEAESNSKRDSRFEKDSDSRRDNDIRKDHDTRKDSDVRKDTDLKPDNDSQTDQPQSGQRSSYIAGLLAEVLPGDDEESEIDDRSKPIKRQSYHERVASLKAVEGDLRDYFKKSVSRKFTFGGSSPKRSMNDEPRLLSVTSDTVESELRGSTSDTRKHSTTWEPLDSRKDSGVTKTLKQKQSWVGSYDHGQDYWSPIPEEDAQSNKMVGYSMDDDSVKPWYDPSMHDQPASETWKQEQEVRGKAKEQWLQSIRKKKEGKMAEDRSSVAPEQSEAFRSRFRSFARGNDFSADGSCMSLPNADKWLEKADLLDYEHVNLLHTGFCFQAVGGSRFEGLKMEEFLNFLRMLAGVTGLTFPDIVDSLSESSTLNENRT